MQFVFLKTLSKPLLLIKNLYISTLCLSLLLGTQALAIDTSPRSISFFYHHIDSVRELLSYDRVVVTPEALSPSQLKQLQYAGVEVFAYLSVGEALPQTAKQFATAQLALNPAWQSTVMDLEHPEWQQYLLTQAKSYAALGFDGLFLDTLDSYQLSKNTPVQVQQQALVFIIDKLALQNHQLILNRGFEILSRLSQPPLAVAAESLYYGYDADSNQYFQQSSTDSLWLSGQLQQVQQQGIEVIVIDYLPDNVQQRLDAAKKVLKQGFTPYIADGLLQQHGVSIHYPVRRRVLGLYDGDTTPKKQSFCHRYLSMLLEYSGYVPDCLNFRAIDAGTFSLSRYAAALLDLPEASYQETQVKAILDKLIYRIPTVFVGAIPSDPALLQQLGLSFDGYYQGELQTSIAPLYPLPSAAPGQILRFNTVKDDIKTIVKLTDSQGASGVAVIKAPWGGALLAPAHIQELVGNRARWLLDPFDYLLPLLSLKAIPAADITTESGQRILTAHIDGDGFPSVAWLPGKPYAAEAIRQRILTRYPIPHTVSVVEAEIAEHGLFPELSAELETIARAIFTLEHVEVASHTFSHPFFWDPRISLQEKLYGDNLPVPDYELDYDREIAGSVDYINTHLTPAGKSVQVYLWSGLANPTPDIIERTNQLGLFNVNGGNTFVLNDNFSYAQVSPHLNWYPGAVQVYAPIMNENLFTELWTENFSGFSRVSETFELLGYPRRLKPVSIYYHMYSGVYPSSLGALDTLYKWAIQQPFTPLYLSDFARRAHSLYETGVAYNLINDSILIRSTGVRSLRLPKDFYLSPRSRGIAGVNQGPDGWYVTLGLTKATLWPAAQQQHLSGRPYLQSANAIVNTWQQQSDIYRITLTSHVPLLANIQQAAGCAVQQASTNLHIKNSNDSLTLSTEQAGTISLELYCADVANRGQIDAHQ